MIIVTRNRLRNHLFFFPTSSNGSSNHQAKANVVEQPKISLNLLEGVKLRQTSKLKQIVDNQQQQASQSNKDEESQSSSNSSNGHATTTVTPAHNNSNSTNNGLGKKLGNRFSMFEQNNSSNGSHNKPSFSSKKSDLSSTSESSKLNEIVDEVLVSQEQVSTPINKITKPLPPVPPNKPQRTVLNSQLANKKDTGDQQPAIMVKLRPVQTNINNSGNNLSNGGSSAFTNHKLNSELSSNIIFNTNQNNLNSVHNNTNNKLNSNLILNENNFPVGVSLEKNCLNNNENGKPTLAKSNGIQRVNQDSDNKRASVRELAQMMFEESKA